VEPDDTAETLAARILELEHRIYPEAIDIVLRGGWRIEGRRVLTPSPAPDDGPGATLAGRPDPI